jgi:hypothetical protein
MQYPVPQFTDVEDKIFGPLTLKQFGIVGGAGLLIFLAYSSTKDIWVTVFVGLIIGVPAIGLAFGKLNGRPLYNSIGSLLGYFLRPRFMLFHKEDEAEIHLTGKAAPVAAEPVVPVESAGKRLKSLYYTLEHQQAEEAQLAKQVKK